MTNGLLSRAIGNAYTAHHTTDGAAKNIGRYGIRPEYFHEGQSVAWDVRPDVLLLLCGKQSGKTTFGVNWLAREIEDQGPGDYAIVGPSLPILNKKALNEAKRFFVRQEKLATYNGNEKVFTFTEDGLLKMFGTTDRLELYRRFAHLNPETNMLEPFDLFEVTVRIHVIPAIDENSLEAGTYKGVWGDEMGHPRVKVTAHENIMARVAAFRARVCYTTTPYALNWLKNRLYDVCVAAGLPESASEFLVGMSKAVACIRFESWMNPQFGRAKFEEMRDSGIPAWRFDLFFRGLFTRPAGQIFDCFDRQRHLIKAGPVPADWPRLWGADFGLVNFAGVKWAFDVHARRAVIYGTYHPRVARDTQHHVERMAYGEPLIPVCRGGAPSEDNWRAEFTALGIPIYRPNITDHETRIQIFYSLLKTGRVVIMEHLIKLIEDIESYSRVVDDDGNPTAEIEDKSTYHRIDALLYPVDEAQTTIQTLDARASA